MELTKLLNLKANTMDYTYTAPAKVESGKNDFEAQLNKSKESFSDKQKGDSKTDRANSSKPSVSDQNKANNEKPKETEAGSSKKSTDSKESSAQDKVEKTDINQVSNEQAPEDQNIKILEHLSEALGLSVEQIQSILDSLSMEATDLFETPSLVDFVQSMLELSGPEELLTSPEAKEMLSSMQEILAGLQSDLQPEKNVTVSKSTEELIADTGSLLANEESAVGPEEMPVKEFGRQNNGNENNLQQEQDAEPEQLTQGNAAEAPTEPQPVTATTQTEVEVTEFSLGAQTTETIERSLVSTLQSKGAFSSRQTQFIVSQVVDNIKLQSGRDFTEMRLTLHPEQLGEVTLRLATVNGVITAQFQAENQKIKEVLESNMESLKNVLEEKGITVSELSVSVGQDEGDKLYQQFLIGREKSQRRIQQLIEGVQNELEKEGPQQIMSENQVDYLA